MNDQNEFRARRWRWNCSAKMGRIRTIMLSLARSRANGQFYEKVVVVWLTLSVASVVLAAANWGRLSRQLNAANQAVATRLEADSIFELLLRAAGSQRDFVITGDQVFVDSLEASATNLHRRFEHLAGLAKSDPALLARVHYFNDQAQASLRYQQQVVLTRKEKGPAAAAAMVAGGGGEEILGALRLDAAAFGTTSTGLVFDRGTGARSQLTRASLTSLVAGILGLGAGVFAFMLSRLTVKHQERESELMEGKLQADRRSQEKTVFLANISHEIRTPMNAILGFGELLETGQLNEKQRDYLQSIRRSASSLLQLINDMLDVSKIEAGVLELHPEPSDPREMCRFIQTMFAEAAVRKHLHLSWKVAEGLPASLLLDRVRLRQILVNLVGNAVKFTDNGSIELRIRSEEKPSGKSLTLVVDVEDTGVGIPPDRLQAIFHPFVQAGAHPDRECQGTGLGLAIVKRLTERMGGSVTVSSKLARGAHFRLRFPEVAVSTCRAPADQLMTSAPTNFNWLRPVTLLGVDDNQSNRQLLEAILSGSHHRLLLASNGREAIEMARQAKPDLILLDVRMPGMDGRQVLRALRQIPTLASIPVIAVTASNHIGDGYQPNARFDGCLQKPYSRQDLYNELARFLPRFPHSVAMLDDSKVSKQAQSPSACDSACEDLSPLAEQKDNPLDVLKHDLKSSLAGVVMSAELLIEQGMCVNDKASQRLVTDILGPGRRLLALLKNLSTHAAARTSAVDGSSPCGKEKRTQENQLPAGATDDLGAQCGRMQADAQKLCRRMTRRAEARSLRLAENILRSCTELATCAALLRLGLVRGG
jgi:signal transduction histidine kinase/DNA-binding response OmpR family regulator